MSYFLYSCVTHLLLIPTYLILLIVLDVYNEIRILNNLIYFNNDS